VSNIVEIISPHSGVDVNFENANGANALIAASSNGHLELVRYLIRAGANVNHQESDGWTAVMFASIRVN
jgi:ankyrin repeat protein